MSKVWVLLHNQAYEGYSLPLGVYSSEEAAERAEDKLVLETKRKLWKYKKEDLEIEEYEIED